MGSMSHHIMPLVDSLRGEDTHTHIHTETNFKKPGVPHFKTLHNLSSRSHAQFMHTEVRTHK